MQIALFAAILLIVISVPAAYAATLQLVTENGNVFSIDFEEIVSFYMRGNQTDSNNVDCALPDNEEVLVCKLKKQLEEQPDTTDPNFCNDHPDSFICELEQEVEDLRGNQTDSNNVDCDLPDNEEVLVCKLKKQLEEQPDVTDADFCDDYPDTLVCQLNAQITSGDCNLPGNEELLICRLSKIITLNDPN